jgi:hypothetical protein
VAEKHAGKFVACYRVSTQRQGRSGLGLSERTKAALASAKARGKSLSAFGVSIVPGLPTA